MKVSILCPDSSSNCLGRSYLLAKLLQKHYQVEIVGPILGKDIWDPVKEDTQISYQGIKIWPEVFQYFQLNRLLGLIKGDVIYVQKPLLTSFSLGLIKEIRDKKVPLILDIDDLEK